MADMITDLTELAATPADGDLLAIVDVSDPGTGTTKKITRQNLVAGLSSSITVEEQDGAPSVAATKIKFPNGKVTDDGGGVVSVAVGGDLVEDTSPQLGGDLDMNGFRLVGQTISQNSQSAAYTTVLADGGKHILHPTADNNARTFTIDSNDNVPYPIGTAITFINQINTLTIAITTDTMTLAGFGTTGSRTLAANAMATAIKISATEWIISGTIGLT